MLSVATFLFFSLSALTAFAQEPPKEKPAAPGAQPPSAAKAAPKPSATKIAFFQIEAQGVEPKVSSIVTDMILGELNKMKDTNVIGSREIDAMWKMGSDVRRHMTLAGLPKPGPGAAG